MEDADSGQPKGKKKKTPINTDDFIFKTSSKTVLAKTMLEKLTVPATI